MDIKDIEQFMKNGGGKVAFIEDGKISFILLSYSEYKKLAEKNQGENLLAGDEKEIVFGLTNKEEEARELTIDDLPF